MKSIYIYFVFFLICMFSCQKEKTAESKFNSIRKDSCSLILRDTLIIPIDVSTSYQQKYLQYIGNNLLGIHNRNNNTVQIYDLTDKVLKYSYQIPKDGKYGTRSYAKGFHIKSADSIFILSDRQYRILLLNKKSEVVKIYSIYSESDQSAPISYTNKPLLMRGHYLYLAANPHVYYDGEYWTHPLFIRLNTVTEDFKYYFLPSEEFKGKMWGAFHNHHGYALNEENEVVHNFSFDENLYIRDLDETAPKMTIEAPSKYFSDIPPWQTLYDPENNGHEEFYVTANSYKQLLYDKWRHVYYRFAERGVDYYDTAGEKRNWTDKKISVMILDQSFNTIGETDLPQSRYYIADSFVAEDGLYISANNDKNPMLNEDEFNFHIYELVKE